MKTYPSLPVALYARVATQPRAEPGPLADQVAALRQRIAADGGQLDAEFEFVDAGFSGASLLRPALERLRQQAAQGALDRLYVADPARLTRSAAHYVVLLAEFRRAGVEVIFVDADCPV